MPVPRRSELYYASDSPSPTPNAAGSDDSPVSVAGNSQFLSSSDCSSNGECCSSGMAPWELDEVDPLGARSTDKEMIPMTQIFMDRAGNDHRAFTHRGRLVYTRAPAQKALNCPARLKKNKQLNAEEVLQPKPIEQSVRDEPDLSMKLNKVELLKLQSQVEELKLKVRDKEGLLQSIKQSAQSDIKLLEEAEISDLRNKVDFLHTELLRRDFLVHSLQHQLSEKHVEMGNMKLLIQGLQNELAKREHKHSQMESDMDDLRFEVAALRYENQIAGSPHFVPQPDQMMIMSCESMEETRDRYLAAVLAAKNKPAEESIALAAELRHQLRDFVTLPHVFHE
ncbi:uncharacterized protein LOC9653484 [Selaginella moellendorffii]|uniref:uncharacterized protein LOC9653484 n=1 Tax=Selaginella moellendorffii TaxID=88036 RepID=UPI000D1C8D7B|nr:uncharacterized protein LOC9653484 [Selaginella moellendorffii]|eukprot:XP_024515336.1 uncharacterized protein LOC9653484 [Selaginella moellendorffii]